MWDCGVDTWSFLACRLISSGLAVSGGGMFFEWGIDVLGRYCDGCPWSSFRFTEFSIGNGYWRLGFR